MEQKMIAEFGLYVLKVIYLMLPGVLANMAPIIVKGQFGELAIPVDNNRRIDKHRLFGKTKTYRGIVFAILFSIVIATIQKILYRDGILKEFVLIDYSSINIFVFGLVIGLGVILGDLIKSFIKRRRGIESSKPWMPWDQIDSPIGAIVLFSIFYGFYWVLVVTVIVLSFVLHVSIRGIAYYLKITKERF